MRVSVTHVHWREHSHGASTQIFATLRTQEYLSVMRDFFSRPNLSEYVRAMERAILAHNSRHGAHDLALEPSGDCRISPESCWSRRYLKETGAGGSSQGETIKVIDEKTA